MRTDALLSLTDLLAGGATERQAHQAPVSHRVLPRVLGRLREVQSHTEATATSSLASVTDNPVFLPPREDRPLGALISNGGYHNDGAHPALDACACLGGHRPARPAPRRQALPALDQRAAAGRRVDHQAAPHDRGGNAEEARTLAQTTVLGLGGFGQNDLPSPAFLAWGKADAVGTCLDRTLAVLAALASQVLYVAGQPPPPALAPFLSQVRTAFPPMDAPRRLSSDAERLAAAFSPGARS